MSDKPAFKAINPRFPETDGFHKFRWENTEYKFLGEYIAPRRTLPNCFMQTNSLVIDRKGSHITDDQIFERFGDSIAAVAFRPDLYYTQLFFEDDETAKQAPTRPLRML